MTKFALIAISTLSSGLVGAMFASVSLQPTTPGTAESGNIHVSGTIIGSKLIAGGNLTSSASVITAYSPVATSTGVQAIGLNFGMRGQSQAASGLAYGGYFDTNSVDGYGLWAKNKAGGESLAAFFEGRVGVSSTSALELGVGKGKEINAGKIAYQKFSDSLDIVGAGTTGTNRKIKFFNEGGAAFTGKVNVNNSSLGGFYALVANGGTSSGLRGETTGAGSVGVSGGMGDPSGYAIYSNGRMHVSGTLTKNGGAFRIDHPLDPENKYLSHSFVESPDMMNIYNGIVTTDAQGVAWIDMPDYFDALNRDFRYQLTILDESDDSFALAKVYRPMKNRRFAIKTNGPNIKVSWQVTGIRKDPWAEQNRIQVVEEKNRYEKGTYQSPEVYGLPIERGLSYRLEHRTSENTYVPPAQKQSVRKQ
jgi:hypothetical protein